MSYGYVSPRVAHRRPSSLPLFFSLYLYLSFSSYVFLPRCSSLSPLPPSISQSCYLYQLIYSYILVCIPSLFFWPRISFRLSYPLRQHPLSPNTILFPLPASPIPCQHRLFPNSTPYPLTASPIPEQHPLSPNQNPSYSRTTPPTIP